MNGQQLKNSILKLAIQGKLVPQDSSDEPASVLLSRIREEKQRLVDEKIIKKEKALAPITEEEKPFDIPNSWEWVRLGEIASLYIGKTPERGNTAFWSDNDYPWISISDMTEYGHVKTTKECISKKASALCFRRISPMGSLIMSFKLTVGRTSILDIDAFHNEAIVTIERFCDDNNFIRDYLFYLLPLLSNMGDSKDAIKGKTLNSTSLNHLITPLPPLAEQHRIVAKIEELLPFVEEYDEAQKKLDKLNDGLPEKLKKSVLQQAIMGRLGTQNDKDEPASELLKRIKDEKAKLIKEKKIKKEKALAPITDDEKPFDIPESWEWVRLGEIGDWGAGATPAKGNMYYYNNGTIPWLRTGDLNNGTIKNVEMRITEKALSECSLRICNIGDVLIAMYGATIGKVAIAGIKLTTNQACCACTPLCLYNKYLFYFLQANKDVFIKMGAGGAQPNISREKIINTLFPLPPLAEQHRIVAKIEELLTMIERIKLK